MIVKKYDIGWGTKWPMKQLEQQIVDRVVAPYDIDDSKTVIINSVWYSSDYHATVMQELKEIRPTRVVVVAMLDSPIIHLDWFRELSCEIVGVGYYPGQIEVDYFALFMDQFYQPIDQDVLLDGQLIDAAFMCLNRKPHLHRVRLYKWIESTGLLDRGIVSLGGNPPVRVLDDDPGAGTELAPNGSTDQYGINNDIASLGNINRWCRHFVNIVTETDWNVDASNFLSEKTFKPILGLRPFLIHAPNGGEGCLTRRGFESYSNDFKDITDLDLRDPTSTPKFLDTLCSQPNTYWKMKFLQLKEKLLFNKEQFERHVSKQKNIL